MSAQRRAITVADQEQARRCAQGRVILIDDDAEVLQALGALIAFEGYAVDTYASAQACIDALAVDTPRFPGPVCLLCDVNMPALSGLDLQQKMLSRSDMPFLLMSGVSGAHEVASAFRAGAVDFLIKPLRAETLLASIDKALDLSRRQRSEQSRQADLSNRVSTLSDREHEVVRLVAQGMTNQAIADVLRLALRTVKLHRQRGMEKLGVETTADLVRVVDRFASR